MSRAGSASANRRLAQTPVDPGPDAPFDQLKAMESWFSLRFSHVDEGQARLERRLDVIDAKLDDARETVARLVGERDAGGGGEGAAMTEDRSVARRLSVGGAIAVGLVTILGGLSAAYEMAERLLSAIVRAISAP